MLILCSTHDVRHFLFASVVLRHAVYKKQLSLSKRVDQCTFRLYFDACKIILYNFIIFYNSSNNITRQAKKDFRYKTMRSCRWFSFSKSFIRNLISCISSRNSQRRKRQNFVNWKYEKPIVDVVLIQ